MSPYNLQVLKSLLVNRVQVNSYDNSQFGSYNQQSALKDFQPAPKYNAGNAHSTAPHTNYGTQSHTAGQTFGANAAAASTSAPLAAAQVAQQQVGLHLDFAVQPCPSGADMLLNLRTCLKAESQVLVKELPGF